MPRYVTLPSSTRRADNRPRPSQGHRRCRLEGVKKRRTACTCARATIYRISVRFVAPHVARRGGVTRDRDGRATYPWGLCQGEVQRAGVVGGGLGAPA